MRNGKSRETERGSAGSTPGGSGFLPLTARELEERGISRPDVILVTGDAYIDSPYCGVAVIGRVLEDAGYTVAVIAQPDVSTDRDIAALGEPRLFWGITAGCVDSEVANYTALGKPRRSCDFTPGAANTRRPDRACIVYANLVRRSFKATVPIVLGGIEASLRRVAHYDYRSDRVRRSVLLDAKADILVYGMGERTVLDIADALGRGRPAHSIPGTCVAASQAPEGYSELPSFEAVRESRREFARMFNLFYECATRRSAPGLVQRHGSRYLVHHPPARALSSGELDRVHELPFLHEAHPVCREQGEIRALDTIKDSIVTHRGCFGECSFCAIGLHQGRSVVSRSMESITREAETLSGRSGFSGTIRDAGGPTANMYGSSCSRLDRGEPCRDKRCIGHGGVCAKLRLAHGLQLRLLQRLKGVPGVKRVLVASGIRHDLILADQENGVPYLERLLKEHVPGQLKIAPEHCSGDILRLMNKPPAEAASRFAGLVRRTARKAGRRGYLSCYVIAAHPGCTEGHMREFLRFARSTFRFVPEQVQIFTPTPSTRSTAMYHCGFDPFTGEKVWSERSVAGKRRQKEILTRKGSGGRKGGKAGRAERTVR
jgi:uncharacterized radical SAM protein YgiQ